MNLGKRNWWKKARSMAGRTPDLLRRVIQYLFSLYVSDALTIIDLSLCQRTLNPKTAHQSSSHFVSIATPEMASAKGWMPEGTSIPAESPISHATSGVHTTPSSRTQAESHECDDRVNDKERKPRPAKVRGRSSAR